MTTKKQVVAHISTRVSLSPHEKAPGTSEQGRPASRRLTPLGALIRLRRDRRTAEFTSTDHRVLTQLIQLCDKATAAVALDSAAWLILTTGQCKRTVVRSLRRLDMLGILSYTTGCGRGKSGFIHLLIEQWGGSSENKTTVSPFPSNRCTDRARAVHPTVLKVGCTQPFAGHSPRRATPSPISQTRSETSAVVRCFHERASTPRYRLNCTFLVRECAIAASVLEQFPRKVCRRAWDLLWSYYECSSRRRKPRSVGLWRFYCEHLLEIEAHERAMSRVRALRQAQRAKVIEEAVQSREAARIKALPGAVRAVLQNPCNTWAREVVGLSLLSSSEEGMLRRELSDSMERCEAIARHIGELRASVARIGDPAARDAAEHIIEQEVKYLKPSQKGMEAPVLPSGQRELAPTLQREWENALARLKGKLFPTTFRVWISQLVPISREGGTWTIAAPDQFVASWVEEHYQKDIAGALGEGAVVRIVVQ